MIYALLFDGYRLVMTAYSQRAFLWKTRILKHPLTFLIIALIAAFLGFGGIAAGAASIAKVLFFVFLALFIFSVLFGRRRV